MLPPDDFSWSDEEIRRSDERSGVTTTMVMAVMITTVMTVMAVMMIAVMAVMMKRLMVLVKANEVVL